MHESTFQFADQEPEPVTDDVPGALRDISGILAEISRRMNSLETCMIFLMDQRIKPNGDTLRGTNAATQPVSPGDVVVLKKKPGMLCQHEVVVDKPTVERVTVDDRSQTGMCRLCGARFINPHNHVADRYEGWRNRFDGEAADRNDGKTFDVLNVRSPSNGEPDPSANGNGNDAA